MQVYKGLDIVTNKVSEDEQKQAKHHMINFLDPLSRYSVVDFRNKSLDVIANLHAQSKIPIIVGGTNYYIESILWKSITFSPTFKPPSKRGPADQDRPESDCYHDEDEIQHESTLMDSEDKYLESLSESSKHTEEDLDDIDKFFSKKVYHSSFTHIDGEKLWKILESVDPNMAYTYHPNDKRRIIRMLQVIQENGRKRNYTDVVNEANRTDDSEAPRLGGSLRYPATCVIWLACDNEILDKKIDERVDLMLERGLLEEMEEFHRSYNEKRLENSKLPEYDKGIFQTIGFKEFHRYLMLDDASRNSEEAKKILKQSIELMKFSTRRYARRQLKWIRRRFLQRANSRELPTFFKLTTHFDEGGWKADVLEPAMKIVEQFLRGDEYDEEVSRYIQPIEESNIVNEPAKFFCDVCDRLLIGSFVIDQHLNSRKHKRNASERLKDNESLESSEVVRDTTTEGADCHVTENPAITPQSTNETQSLGIN